MTLSEQQRIFTLNIAMLIQYAYANGYQLTFGDAYRDPRLAALNAQQGRGIANSLHTQRLAVDFNLFRGGEYLVKSEDYAPLGVFWKNLHPLNRWGGDFKPVQDGNHFSMTYGGIQ